MNFMYSKPKGWEVKRGGNFEGKTLFASSGSYCVDGAIYFNIHSSQVQISLFFNVNNITDD